MTYTEKTSDLNPETLGEVRRPARSTPTRPRSRRSRRRRCSTTSPSGGGFVPLHCASYCFLQLARVHRRWSAPSSRGTAPATFEHEGRRPRPPDHEGARAVRDLGRDLRPHQAQREGPPRPRSTARRATGKEPWTWVRTQGKGRVFYTAWGHDAADLGPPRLPGPASSAASAGPRSKGDVVRLRRPATSRAGPEAVRVRAGRRSRSTRPARSGARSASRSRKMQKPLAARGVA